MADDAALTEAAALATPFEGFRGAPYQDSGGVWTIGYGTTRQPDGSPVGPATPAVDEPTALAWLMRDMTASVASVRSLVTVPVNDAQVAALADFAYNLGTGALASPTLLRLLNGGDYEGAAAQFERWDMAGGVVLPGLVRRRQAERVMFERALAG